MTFFLAENVRHSMRGKIEYALFNVRLSSVHLSSFAHLSRTQHRIQPVQALEILRISLDPHTADTPIFL